MAEGDGCRGATFGEAFATPGRSRDGETRLAALAWVATPVVLAVALRGTSETLAAGRLPPAAGDAGRGATFGEAFVTPGRSRDGETRPVATAALGWVTPRTMLGDVQRGFFFSPSSRLDPGTVISVCCFKGD